MAGENKKTSKAVKKTVAKKAVAKRDADELDLLQAITRRLTKGGVSAKVEAAVQDEETDEDVDDVLEGDEDLGDLEEGVEVSELVIDDDGEVSGKKRARVEAEPEDALEPEEEPLSVVDIVLATIAAPEDEDEEEEPAKPRKKETAEDEDEDEDEDLSVTEKKADEFTCLSCYLILKRHLMAGDNTCRDCA